MPPNRARGLQFSRGNGFRRTIGAGALAFILLVLFSADPAKAQLVWAGNTSTNWNTGANWTSGSVPTTSGNVVIDTGSGNKPLISNANAAADFVTVGLDANSTANTSLTIQAGSILAASGNGSIGSGKGSTGAVFVSGANSLWSTNGDLTVGDQGTGNLTLSQGGNVTDGGLLNVGASDGALGTILITDPNSTLNSPNGMIVGNAGTGNLTVANGGRVNSWTFTLGNSGGDTGPLSGGGPPGGVGTALVTGTNSTLSLTNSIQVGFLGAGNLTVANGGNVTSTGNLGIGVNGLDNTSNGSVQVTDAHSLLNVAFDITVGAFYGTGNLTVTNGGNATSGGNLTIGSQGTGTVLVSDPNSTLSLAGNIAVGRSFGGTGNSLTVANGGQVTSNGSLALGYGTTGSMLITGTNSTLTVANGVMVSSGNNVNGTLTIANGGRLAAGTIIFGGSAGASAVLNLNGGGVLQVGGNNGIQSGNGTVAFNWAGGDLQIDNLDLHTAVNATLVANTTSVLDTNGFNASWSGMLSGGGAFAKIGHGILTFSGNNAYTGATNLTGGMLALTGNGAISSSNVLNLAGGSLDVSALNGAFAVGANQTLAGSGNITGSATVNGGLLPGATGAVGTLGFSQNLTLGASATTTLQIAGMTPVTQYSTVNVAGNLTAGGRLVVNFLNGFLPSVGSKFYLFITGNSLAGTFSNAILPSLTNLYWDLSGLYRHGDIAVVSSFTYTGWASDLGLTGNDALPNARPYSDGLPNQVRYAMNLDATTTSAQLPGTSVSNVSGVNYLTIQYRVRKNMTDFQLVPQSSTDLITWTNVGAGNISQLADDDAFTSRYQAQVALPNGGQVFLRVVAQPQ